MPKLSSDRTSQRSAPYNLEVSTTMPGQVFMPLVAPAPADWQYPYDHAQNNMIPLQDVTNSLPPAPHLSQQQQQHQQGQPRQQHQQQQQSPYLTNHHYQHQPQQRPRHHHQQVRQRHEQQPPTPTLPPGQSGPWSTHDDEVLVKARTMNMAWGAIQDKHFPSKTGNACRKRYERLMLKRRGNHSDWDEDRTARLAVAYKEMREQTWSPLAEQLGERWDHVEKACMEKGLKNMLNLAANHSRTTSNRHSKTSSSSETEGYLRDRKKREDSGVAFAADSSSRRSSQSNPGAMPTWQQILQPSRHQ